MKWSPAEAFSLSAGRLDFLFAGLERTVSSTKIATFERGLLVNQLLPGEVVGAVAQGKVGDFFYRAGVFSGSIDQEFTTFAGGFGAVAGVGYELPLFYAEGSLHLDYLYNNGNPSNNALKPYDHVVSLWHQGQTGPFGLGVDVTFGHGLDARPAVFGVTVLPTYVFAKNVIRKGDALQAVLALPVCGQRRGQRAATPAALRAGSRARWIRRPLITPFMPASITSFSATDSS